MISFATWIRLFWMAVIAVTFTSCNPSKEQAKTDDSAQTRTRAKRGDRSDSMPRRTSFESELKTVEEMTDPGERDGALATLASDALMDHPDLAQMAILKLPPDSPHLPGLLRGYLSALLNSESADALAWVDSLEDQGMAGMAREILAELVPDEQLEAIVPRALEAGKIAATGFKPADELMLQRWASFNPQAVATWLANMPTGESRNQGLRNLSRGLAQMNDQTAANWLKSLPNEELRANARQDMAAALLETPAPIREALLGAPDSELRLQLGELLAQLQPPPEPEYTEEIEPQPDAPEFTE
jgi:hypothetical protein